MRRKLSIISMGLALVMCISSIAFAADTSDDNFYTNEQADYISNYTLFDALGIFNSEMSANVYSDKITQKKAIEYGLELINANYNDNNIAAMAKTAGFINSESDYRPNGMLTQTEAARIFVSALGYNAQANMKSGYLAYAKKLGIFKGVEINSKVYVTYAAFYQMMINSFDVKLSMVASVSGDLIKFEIADDENILSCYFGIDTVEGVVSENDLSTFYLPANNGYGALIIGGKTFWYNDFHAYELLGHNIRAYVKDNDRVVYATPYKSPELSITDDEFNKYTGTEITYYVDSSDKEKRAKLSSKPIVLYNDVAYPHYTKTDLENFNGKLVLVDNDNNGSYDVIKIYDYTEGFVDTINSDKNTIRFSRPENTYKDMSAYSDDQISVYNKDGLKVVFGYIMDKDFVRIAESKGKNKCRIEVHRDYFDGVLVSMRDDTVKINDGYYDIASFFKDESSKLTSGSEYRFYIDNAGRVVGVDKIEDSSLKYAFIMGATKDFVFSTNCRIKLINDEGEIKIYDLADRVRVDGVSYKDWQVYDKLVQDNGSVRQLIKYRVNAGGKLTVIDTSREVAANSYDTLKTEAYTSFSVNYRSDYGIGMFGGKVLTNKEATFFRVPKVQSEDPNFYFDDDYYAVGKKYSNAEDKIIQNSGDYIEFADVGDNRRCDVAVYYTNTPFSKSDKVPGNGKKLVNSTNNRAPMAVREIMETLDENGDKAYRVILEKRQYFTTNFREYADEKGNWVSIVIPEKDENLIWKKVYNDDMTEVSGAHTWLEPGDIVQFTVDPITNKIDGSNVVYDISLKPLQNAKLLSKNGNQGYGRDAGYSVAILDWVDNDGTFGAFMTYDTETGTIDTSEGASFVLRNSAGQMVTKFDTGTKNLYQIDLRNAKDIHTYPDDYDYLLISSYYGQVNAVNVID